MTSIKPQVEKHAFKKKALCGVMAMLLAPASAFAQQEVEEVVVTGIRSALVSALIEKRDSENLIEVIQAEDIGKLPDQNLAEVLENVTGIQIMRNAGVGSSVQIRGVSANRVEINGVGTVGQGSNRVGISFEDIPASLISAVEVVKVPQASTIEGSVGGTINLRTIRPLDLSDRVLSFRVQAENSDLAESTSPRFSGTYGNNWTTDYGDVGFVFSASITEQEVASFDPRIDRDRPLLSSSTLPSAEDFSFLRIQFLDQQLARRRFDTKNFSTTLEFAPNDDIKFYLDATYNDQESAQRSARALISGTGGNAPVGATTNTGFETLDFGTVDGINGPLVLGNVQAVTSGIIGVGRDSNGDINSNLRTASSSGSRVTDSSVFALGAEFQVNERLQLKAEVSEAKSETSNPGFTTQFDFINPRGLQPEQGISSDNGLPLIFDTTGGTLQFGIAQGLPETPTSAELLDPENYALRSVAESSNEQENKDTAFRLDGEYDLSGTNPIFTAVKAGLRWNLATSQRFIINSSANYTDELLDFFRPRGDLLGSILIPGPDNFGDADGRELFIDDYLFADPDLAFSRPEFFRGEIDRAIAQRNADTLEAGFTTEQAFLDPLGQPNFDDEGFFEIDEETTALYIQGDFELDAGVPIRGNIGLRYVQTDIDSVGNQLTAGVVTAASVSSDYNFVLPRFNLVAELHEDVILRFGAAKDINRPAFDDLSISATFGNSATAPVRRGNPELEPQEVTSFDIAAEYYFSESGFATIGFFHKDRNSIFGPLTDNPIEPIAANGQIERDITAPCEDGGVFNANADRNVFSSQSGTGICVPLETVINIPGEETQTGVEIAVQYDLGDFEDSLGWASGFGAILNYTYQEPSSSLESFIEGNGDGNALNLLLGRTDDSNATPNDLTDDVVTQRRELPNLSQNAYNATIFYDKYDFSFRARYTWRSDFTTEQTISFDLPRIVADRAQLNLSASYALNDNVTVGVDAINLLRNDRAQFCVQEGALLCSQGLTDRRIVLGVSVAL